MKVTAFKVNEKTKPPETKVEVRKRGKSFIAFENLATLDLPGFPIKTIPLLIFEGEPYIPVEYGEALVRKPKGEGWNGRAVYPTLDTVRVTCGSHKISRSFITDFGVIRGEDGEWQCERHYFIRHHTFIHLYRFAAFSHEAGWNPNCFFDWDKEREEVWRVRVFMAADIARLSVPYDEGWKEKAFCSPTGEFLGRKPGNKLTYDEMYRYGERKATRQRKTRRDMILMPWEKEEDRKRRNKKERRVTITFHEAMEEEVKKELERLEEKFKVKIDYDPNRR